MGSNFVFDYRQFGTQKRHFHVGKRVIPQIRLLHVLNFSVRIFDSFGVNRAELRVQVLLKQICLFVFERIRDEFSNFSIAASLVADLSVLNGLGLELALGLGLAWPKQMEPAASKLKQQRLNSLFIRDS